MFRQFLDILESTREYQEWGLNAATVGAIGATIFIFIEMWGLHKQGRAIQENPEKKGESVSVIWFSYCFFTLVTGIFYGVHIKSALVLFNSIPCGILHIPVLIGLWKYKGFTRQEKILFVLFAGMVPAIAFLPWKNDIFMAISVGVIYAMATQPWELWKTKKRGVVEIRLLAAYTISTAFWVVYAFAIDEWVLEVLTTANLLTLCVSTALWFFYGANERARAS